MDRLGSTEFLLRGTLVNLRTTRLSDLADYERWDNPGLKAWQFDGPWLKSRADEVGLAEWRRGGLERQVPPYPFLEVESAQGVHIGWVTVYHRATDPHMTEVGINIVEESYWGKGLGSKALRLWIDYQFRSRNLSRIGFSTWSGNPAMIRVGRKLGFRVEARIRKGCEVDGKFYDRLKLGVLRSEWNPDR